MAQPIGSYTLEAMWLLCCSIMRQMEVVISGFGAAEAAPLVVTFTAQLQQSGEVVTATVCQLLQKTMLFAVPPAFAVVLVKLATSSTACVRYQ
jgi:hypothetical protein